MSEHGLPPGSLEITDAALRLVISEYTREAGVRNLERQLGAIARKVAAQHRDAAGRRGPAGQDRRRSRPGGRLPRARPVQEGSGVPHLAARRGDRRGLDRNGRRRPFHRSDLASRRKPEHHSHGPARQRDAGVGPRGPQPHPVARRGARDLAGFPGEARSPRPRSGGRDPEGRPVGGRDDGDGDPVGGAEPAGAAGRGDDRRDHAERTGAARRRHPGEGAGGAAVRNQDVHPAGAQRARPGGAA